MPSRLEVLLGVMAVTIISGLFLLGDFTVETSSGINSVPINLKGSNDHTSDKKEFAASTYVKASPKYVAILCLERSGSTWLTAMLNKNEGVNLLAEPLTSLAGPSKKDPNPIVSASKELSLLMAKVDKLAELNESISVIGFNEKFVSPKYALPSTSQVLSSFESYLKTKKYKIIVLVRKNLVFQAVSMIRAVQLADKCGNAGWSKVSQKEWDSVCGKHHSIIQKQPLPIEALEENIKLIRAKTAQLLKVASSLNMPHLVVYYEDLYDSPEQTMKNISKWIDYDVYPAETLYVKQGSSDMTKSLTNIHQVRRFIQKFDPCLIEHLDHFNPAHTCSL